MNYFVWFAVIPAIGFIALIPIACFVHLVLLRGCYQCGISGGKKYVLLHSDGMPVTMQYCDDCAKAVGLLPETPPKHWWTKYARSTGGKV